jgi:hypothetical protein
MFAIYDFNMISTAMRFSIAREGYFTLTRWYTIMVRGIMMVAGGTIRTLGITGSAGNQRQHPFLGLHPG